MAVRRPPRVNLEAMCRLCMTEDEVVLFSLRTGQVPARFEVPNPVAKKIRKLFNITAFEEGMPDKICHNCLIRVDTFYSFNTIVEAGQYKLTVLTRKSNDAENPEGARAVDNPVLSFSKFKKYGPLRPGAQTFEEQNRSDTGMITVTRPSVPDTVRVRVKPYSVPAAAAAQAGTSAAPPGQRPTSPVAGPSGASAEKQEHAQFGCEVCSETFYVRRLLLNHILAHYQDNIYTCHLASSRDCEAKVWFSSCEFREHLVAEHRRPHDSLVVIALSQRAQAEVCLVCMAGVHGSLEEHMQAAHEGSHCCRVCRKWFTSGSALHLHVAQHD